MKQNRKRVIALLALFTVCFSMLTVCFAEQASADAPVTKLADLEGKKAASLSGTVFSTVLDKEVKNVRHLYFSDLVTMIEAVKTGKVSAILMDEPTAQLLSRQYPDLEILQEKLADDRYGYAIRKGDPLGPAISGVIERFRGDGTLDQIAEKWFGADEAAKVLPTLNDKSDFDGSAGTIHFAHDNVMVPMSYVGDDGKSRGYEIELLMRVAYELNMEIEMQGMAFDALLATLVSGKADIVGGSMSITEERKQSVDFTVPDYEGGMVAVVKKNMDAAPQSSDMNALSQLGKEKIGVLTGSVYPSVLKEYLPEAEPVYFNNLSDQVTALQTGKVAGLIYDEPTVAAILQEQQGLRMLPEKLGQISFAMAAKPENTALIEQVNEVLRTLEASGELAKLREVWYGTDEAKKVLPPLDLPKSGKVLRVATSAISPPSVYVKDNQIVGYEMAIAAYVAREMGVGLEIIDMDFSALIPAITAGKADLAAAQIVVTDERKNSVLFSLPDDSSTVRMLVRDSSGQAAAAGAVDAAAYPPRETARIGVMTGSTGEKLVSSMYPGATISSFDSYSDAAAALAAGKLDYVVGSYTSLLNFAKVNPKLTLMEETIGDDANAIAFQKGKNPELVKKIDAIIDQFEADGVLEEMRGRWLKTDNTPYELADVPAHENAELLRVAISADREPICFVQDGNYAGFDCELVERIAYELGMRVEYQNMKFSGLLASLQAGKADLVISNLSYTQERALSVDFSRTYFDNPQALLVQKQSSAAQAVPWYRSFVESFQKTFITENRYQLILQGLGTTLLISICAVLLGTVLGFGVCMLRRAKRRWMNIPAKMFIRLVQGVPIVVILMILFYLVFTDPNTNPIMVAVIGFSINFAAYVSEMMRTGIDAVDKGQMEAASAIGFNKVQIFCMITLPQAARHVLPVFKGEFISMIKMTSVVGYIAIQDLTKMSDIIRSRTYEAFFPLIATAVIYFLVSYLLTVLLSVVEIKIDPKHRKRIVKGVD